jgi:hypothetical protein
MSTETYNKSEEVYIIHSQAECIEPVLGEGLIDEYLDGALTGELLNRFEDHLRRCVACQIDIANWDSITYITKHT